MSKGKFKHLIKSLHWQRFLFVRGKANGAGFEWLAGQTWRNEQIGDYDSDLDLAKTSALKGELTMQCSSCGKTLVPNTTVCPMCKTPVPTRGSAQADGEYTEYADVLHQPIPFVETRKAFFDVQPSSPAQEMTPSEHQDRQLVPPHHFRSQKRAMRYSSMELVAAIVFLLLGLTFLGGALFSSEGFGGHLDKVIIGVLGLITSAIAFGGVAKAHLARPKNEGKAQDR